MRRLRSASAEPDRPQPNTFGHPRTVSREGALFAKHIVARYGCAQSRRGAAARPGGIVVRALAASGLDRFIVPGAADVQIQALSLGAQQITYQTTDGQYGWYFAAVRKLSAEGWSAPVDSRVRLQAYPSVYWRIRPLWFVYVKERVALQGDPGRAQITVSRELIIPWRRYFP